MDADAAYLVLLARDARFDGRWFVGVTSTGVYCRPVCRVRTPHRKNCLFFDTAAQAEAAAFRPCLKCRPELAPGNALPWSVMDASSTLARQAAHWLDTQTAADASPSVAALAERLGINDRHLRRIFLAEHGVTPLQHLQTRRLLLAKHLLTDTRLPMSEVAMASGFGSLRRFNAAFTESYRMSPSRLRQGDRSRAGAPPADDAITVTLNYRPPYDMPSLLRFIEMRAIPSVESVEAQRVRRTLRADALGAGTPAAWIEAEFMPDTPQVRLRFAPQLAPHSAAVVRSARRWLDLDAAPHVIDTALADLPGAPGLRLPGSLDAFELAVRAVLGQQVTVAAARTLARRLVTQFGEPVATPWEGIDRAFPSPDVLARASVDSIGSLGIFGSRTGAIVALGQAWPALAPLLHPLSAPAPLIEALHALPGIGPWTAHYIAMRALGWPDAWPPGDVAVNKALQAHFGVAGKPAITAHAERWRPWRAYAVLRLWNTPAPLNPETLA